MEGMGTIPGTSYVDCMRPKTHVKYECTIVKTLLPISCEKSNVSEWEDMIRKTCCRKKVIGSFVCTFQKSLEKLESLIKTKCGVLLCKCHDI